MIYWTEKNIIQNESDVTEVAEFSPKFRDIDC
jgi:hypothetical protein